MNNNFNIDKFKNLIDYKSGYTWSKDQELNSPENGSIRVLTVTNVQKQLDLSSKLYLKNVTDNDKRAKAVSKNWTIAVSSNGNRKRIGNAVFINEDTEYLFASFLTGFKPKEDSEILPEYFSYWMKSHPVQERITSISEGTTGLGNMDIRYLRNMDIEYPDPPEQRAIASVLTKVDDAIAATKNTIAKAERLKKALMQNLLTGRLKPDGTRRTDDEFYIDEKFGQVPIGWEVCRIRDYGELQTGKTPPTKDENNFGSYYMFVTPGDVGNERIIKLTERYLSERGINYSYKIPPSSVCVVCIGSTIGKIGIVNEECCSNQQIHSVICNENSDHNFLYYFLIYRRRHFREYSGINATPQINKSEFSKYRVLKPESFTEQNEISQKLLSIDESIEKKELKIQKLERLKKALMQNLLTGKKRLKADYIQGFANG